jgi:UDP-N-acetylmuramoylalanine--D-glutamate ligase
MNVDALSQTSVTVVGGARSGRAVARLLAEAGASVFVTEHGPPTKGIEGMLDDIGADYEFGGHTPRALDADLVVVSPGVPTQANILQQSRRAGIPIYSEIEAASWFCEAPIVAITGTNGKTTTTSLTGHLFRTAFDGTDREVIVAGNIGYPFSDYVRDARPEDVVVLEVSSFQLDHVDTFQPRVSVILNITPDHLDRYNHDFNAYAQSKFRIFAQQGEGDTVVYNADDELVREYVRHQAARPDTFTALGISIERPVERGAFLSDDTIQFRMKNRNHSLMPASDLALRGPHNLYNSLAAAVSARVMEVQDDTIRQSLSSFEGVPHRLESVAEIDGVLFVNDSKATNVNAVWYALESFDRPIVLIAGGRDKGNEYNALKPLVRERVRGVVAIGESADTVMGELGAESECATRASTMEDALHKARSLAQRGDVVLLSPACSSFDMYENYEERGDTFRRLVMNL